MSACGDRSMPSTMLDVILAVDFRPAERSAAQVGVTFFVSANRLHLLLRVPLWSGDGPVEAWSTRPVVGHSRCVLRSSERRLGRVGAYRSSDCTLRKVQNAHAPFRVTLQSSP